MEPGFESLLHREPRLYDLAFPDADDTVGRMCREAWGRYLPRPPASALDIGCGTGRHLDSLSAEVADCWGVHLLDANVAYARSARPHLRVVQGDMRAFRLGRSFDLITSLGNALSYALTDDDLCRTVETYRAHSHGDTLVIVDALNAASYLDGGGFRERIEGAAEETPGPGRCARHRRGAADSDARPLVRQREMLRVTGRCTGRPGGDVTPGTRRESAR